MSETVDHPVHYGGADNPHEAIKCIGAHGLGFNLGNAVKYVFRAGRKGDYVEDLRKAAWYLRWEIEASTGPADEAVLTRREYEALPEWLRLKLDRQLARLRA